MEIENPGGRLSNAEVRDLTQLLARFVSHDLDQWENWRIQTSYDRCMCFMSGGALHLDPVGAARSGQAWATGKPASHRVSAIQSRSMSSFRAVARV